MSFWTSACLAGTRASCYRRGSNLSSARGGTGKPAARALRRALGTRSLGFVMARGLCLFAHFDPQDRVDPFVTRYLDALRACDFDVVFVTTAALREEDVTALRDICCDVIQRPNEGLDFASWVGATLLWLGIGSAAVVAAAYRHQER